MHLVGSLASVFSLPPVDFDKPKSSCQAKSPVSVSRQEVCGASECGVMSGCSVNGCGASGSDASESDVA